MARVAMHHEQDAIGSHEWTELCMSGNPLLPCSQMCHLLAQMKRMHAQSDGRVDWKDGIDAIRTGQGFPILHRGQHGLPLS